MYCQKPISASRHGGPRLSPGFYEALCAVARVQEGRDGMAILKEMREGDIVWRRHVVAGRVRKTYRLTP